MLVDLRACAACLGAATVARVRHRAATGRLGMLGVLARGRVETAIERERRATLALVLACLPAGRLVRDRAGHLRPPRTSAAERPARTNSSASAGCCPPPTLASRWTTPASGATQAAVEPCPANGQVNYAKLQAGLFPRAA
jgi:hypothetical protein